MSNARTRQTLTTVAMAGVAVCALAAVVLHLLGELPSAAVLFIGFFALMIIVEDRSPAGALVMALALLTFVIFTNTLEEYRDAGKTERSTVVQ